MSRNKKWSSAAKFEIALQALNGETTINEICARYQVTRSQVHSWKKQLLEDGKQLFGKTNKKSKPASENHGMKEQKLYETIGQLTVERDFLKKSWEKFQMSDDGS